MGPVGVTVPYEQSKLAQQVVVKQFSERMMLIAGPLHYVEMKLQGDPEWEECIDALTQQEYDFAHSISSIMGQSMMQAGETKHIRLSEAITFFKAVTAAYVHMNEVHDLKKGMTYFDEDPEMKKIKESIPKGLISALFYAPVLMHHTSFVENGVVMDYKIIKRGLESVVSLFECAQLLLMNRASDGKGL